MVLGLNLIIKNAQIEGQTLGETAFWNAGKQGRDIAKAHLRLTLFPLEGRYELAVAEYVCVCMCVYVCVCVKERSLPASPQST